nr:MAG TPA: tail tape measure protein [Bacteriophage sp.]
MEVFKILGTIAISGAEKAEKDTKKVAETSEKSAKKIGEAFKKVGSTCEAIGTAIVKVSKIGAAAIGTISTAVGALTKSAVENYAEYEQLVGGVETLFKDSADQVIEYANNAYKTAGLSANEYMDTVTSFSASLLQSLGGDTAKATESANLAITDMADNANKMGTAMESIQNAYQGFAKQNYTMLDNLKLGYGGTKEEMLRLLEDAEKISGIKYDISSFSDIVDAIHVVQTEMNITGTTSKEAATTIQGSISSMKGAWTNFVTGMADETQDFDSLVNNVIDSVLTVASNLVPRIMETLPRLIDGLSQLVQKIVPYIPQLLKTLVPSIVDGAKRLLNEVTEQLPDLLETILPGFGGELGRNIIKFINTFKSIFSKIIPMLQNFGKKILPVISEFLDKILPVFETIIESLLPPLESILDTLIPVLLDLIDVILPPIEKLLPLIMNALASIIEPLAALVEAILPPLQSLLDIILPILSGFLDVLQPILDVVVSLLQPILDLVGSGLNALAEAFGFATEKTSEAVQAARDEADAMRDMRDAANDARDAIDQKAEKELANVSTVESLWQELQTLADEQGNVAEKDRARAEFITGQLSEALGTEIQWTGNQIQNYKDLQEEIDKTIEKKKLEILLEASEEKYKTAIQNRTDAENRLNEASQRVADAFTKRAELEAQGVSKSSQAWKDATAVAAAAQEAFVDAQNIVGEYYADISQYETAQTLIMQGENEKAMDLLNKKGQAFQAASDLAAKSADEQKAILEKQMEDAAVSLSNQVSLYKRMSKNCTDEEREMYEKNLKEAQDYFTRASQEYSKAGGEIGENFFKSMSGKLTSHQFEAVGSYMIQGIADGAEGNKTTLMQKLGKIMNDAFTSAYSSSSSSSSSKSGTFTSSSKSVLSSALSSTKPHLAKGGVLKKGQVGFLEGDGDEAVVPLSQNTEWINRVAEQINSNRGNVDNSEILRKLDILINLISKLISMKIYLDSGALVGELAPILDEELGNIFSDKERGR